MPYRSLAAGSLRYAPGGTDVNPLKLVRGVLKVPFCPSEISHTVRRQVSGTRGGRIGEMYTIYKICGAII